jgi:hypothetical protein
LTKRDAKSLEAKGFGPVKVHLPKVKVYNQNKVKLNGTIIEIK